VDAEEKFIFCEFCVGFGSSKAFALTWYRAPTWYYSPARPFAVLDIPLLVTRQHGSPPPPPPAPRADSFPEFEMRARGAPANTVPS